MQRERWESCWQCPDVVAQCHSENRAWVPSRCLCLSRGHGYQANLSKALGQPHRARVQGFNPSSVFHQLGDGGQVTGNPCALVSLSVKDRVCRLAMGLAWLGSISPVTLGGPAGSCCSHVAWDH